MRFATNLDLITKNLILKNQNSAFLDKTNLIIWILKTTSTRSTSSNSIKKVKCRFNMPKKDFSFLNKKFVSAKNPV
jgi:hypothetical protein